MWVPCGRARSLLARGSSPVWHTEPHDVGVLHGAEDLDLCADHVQPLDGGARLRLLHHLDRDVLARLEPALRQVVPARALHDLGKVARAELPAQEVVGVDVSEDVAEHGHRRGGVAGRGVAGRRTAKRRGHGFQRRRRRRVNSSHVRALLAKLWGENDERQTAAP